MKTGDREKHGYASMIAPRVVVHMGLLTGAGVGDGGVNGGRK